MQPDLITTITRTANAIFSKGGFLRKIDNLGEQQLPFRMHKDSQRYDSGFSWGKLNLTIKLIIILIK